VSAGEPGRSAETGPTRRPLQWLDVTKGIAIVWIVYFHYFEAYSRGEFGAAYRAGWFTGFVDACAPAGGAVTLACAAKAVFVAFSLFGFHAVSVFLVLSGLGLAFAQAGRAERDWRAWMRGRLLRLFPLYWVAHLVVFASPFAYWNQPNLECLVPSLLGVRFLPSESCFYFLNAAWWYFTLLLELYLVFPLLWWLHERAGAALFLVACAAFTIASRWLLLAVWPVDGLWVLGGFFGARLFEFAFGMAIGAALRRAPAITDRRLFGVDAVAIGAVLYALGLASYASLATYTATDALIGAGLFLLLANLARAVATLPRLGSLVCRVGVFSYGLYLLHQPYVIALADYVRPLGLPGAVAVFVPILAILATCSIAIERTVTALRVRFLAARDGRPRAASRRSAKAG